MLQPDDLVLLDEMLRHNTHHHAAPDMLARLREAGCRFETHPGLGAKLIEAGLGTWADMLERHAPSAVVYGQTASTQEIARRLFEERGTKTDGFLALAHHQTRGRGRLGRQWIAPPGSSATFSRVCVLDNRLKQTPDRITLAASVAVARALAPLLGREPGIKWPNDIFIDGKKIAGILVETLTTDQGAAAIVGIGINVAMTRDELPVDTATSFAVLGRPIDRLRVLCDVAEQLTLALALPETELLDHWRTHSTLLHQSITLKNNGRVIHGEVIDLDPLDGLIVRDDHGTIVHLPAATTTVVV